MDEEEEEDIDSETGSMMRKISSPRSSNQVVSISWSWSKSYPTASFSGRHKNNVQTVQYEHDGQCFHSFCRHCGIHQVAYLFKPMKIQTQWPYDCHRMSSNKTASQLVGLLNDLFGRWPGQASSLPMFTFLVVVFTHHHHRRYHHPSLLSSQ